MGGLPLKPLFLFLETIQALKTRPPKHAAQVRRGLVNANFHEHGHTLHSLTSPGIGFFVNGKEKSSSVVSTSFSMGWNKPP